MTTSSMSLQGNEGDDTWPRSLAGLVITSNTDDLCINAEILLWGMLISWDQNATKSAKWQ